MTAVIKGIKAAVIVLLGFILLCGLVLGGLYLYMDNAPLVRENYREKVETGGALEAAYLQDGPYAVEKVMFRAEKPIGKYTIFYPGEMETSERVWPMVLFANGTGGKASRCEPMLRQLASWGFVVVGTQDKNTGTGETTIQALNEMLAQNGDPDSRFNGKIDVENIGVTGFSQGGAAAIRAVTMFEESRYFKTVVPLSPVSEQTAAEMTDYPYDSGEITCPILLLAGTSGEFETEIVIPSEAMSAMYEAIPAPKAMARRVGMTHDDMLVQAGGYVAAWFRWQLQGDMEAAEVFLGEAPELLQNPIYQDQQIDLIQ